MDWAVILITVLAIGAGLFGIIGSIIPGLPGPPVSWVGMLLVFLWGGPHFSRSEMGLTLLLVMGVVMVVVSILDYVLPATLTKATGGSKYGSRGAMLGLLAGLAVGIASFGFGLIAMLILPFVGAYIGEKNWGGQADGKALKSAMGSFLGLLAGTGIKLIYAGGCCWFSIRY